MPPKPGQPTNNWDPEDTPVKKKAFLLHYRQLGTIRHAAVAAGIGRNIVFRWKEHDPEFSMLFNQAREEYTEELEREMYRRAVEGVTEPVYYRGAHIDDVKKFSDTLLIFALKARRPEVYRERFEVRGEVQQTLTVHALREALGIVGSSDPPPQAAATGDHDDLPE